MVTKVLARIFMEIQHDSTYYTISQNLRIWTETYWFKSKMGQFLSQFESSTSRQPKKGNPNLDGWAEAGTACPRKRKHHPSLYGNLPAPLETPTISQGKSAAGYVDIRFRSW